MLQNIYDCSKLIQLFFKVIEVEVSSINCLFFGFVLFCHTGMEIFIGSLTQLRVEEDFQSIWVACQNLTLRIRVSSSLCWHRRMISRGLVPVASLSQERKVSLCRPLALRPSTAPVRATFSRAFLRSMWPKKRICLDAIVLSNVRDDLVLSSTSSFEICSVHDILIIQRRNHISVASRRCCMTLLIVQHLHPYRNVGHTQQRNSLSLVGRVIDRVVNIPSIFLKVDFAMPIHRLISVSHLASGVTTLPRYMYVNSSTCSRISSLTLTLHRGAGDDFEKTRQKDFLRFNNKPFCSLSKTTLSMRFLQLLLRVSNHDHIICISDV